MGNFERGVEKKFKGDKEAQKKYQTKVKQGANRLSQAKKISNSRQGTNKTD